MEKLTLDHNVKVFGMQVKTFPEGVGEAFELLMQKISEEYDRSYYGISYINSDGEIVYKAAAEERFENEAEKYDCDRYVIEKGEYQAVLVKDWRKKTDCIKDVFHEMMQGQCSEKNWPCIEWYKNDEEMLCMIKSKL